MIFSVHFICSFLLIFAHTISHAHTFTHNTITHWQTNEHWYSLSLEYYNLLHARRLVVRIANLHWAAFSTLQVRVCKLIENIFCYHKFSLFKPMFVAIVRALFVICLVVRWWVCCTKVSPRWIASADFGDSFLIARHSGYLSLLPEKKNIFVLFICFVARMRSCNERLAECEYVCIRRPIFIFTNLLFEIVK